MIEYRASCLKLKVTLARSTYNRGSKYFVLMQLPLILKLVVAINKSLAGHVVEDHYKNQLPFIQYDRKQ